MTNEKILPIYAPMAATSRPQLDILSLFEESDKNMIWFIAYFFSLSIQKGGDVLQFADEMTSASLFDTCPMIVSRSYDLGVILDKWGSFSSFVTDQIARGYYIYAYSDIYYIDAYKLHRNKNHITHPMLIYGCDQTENAIYGQDFFYYTLEREKTDASQLEEGVKNLSPHFRVTCFKKRAYYNLIDVKYITRVLQCHMESRSVWEDNIFLLNGSIDKYVFGLGCYDELQNSMRRAMLVGCEEINHHTCHAIPDHINILGALLRYLRGQNPLLVSGGETNSKIKSLADKSQVYQNLCLKYNATKNRVVLGKVAGLLPQIKEEEESLLRDIYDGIDAYRKNNAHLLPQYNEGPHNILCELVPIRDVAESYLYDGSILHTVTGDDPVLMNRSVTIDASAMKYIYIKFNSTCRSETAQIFFARAEPESANADNPYVITEENSVSFTYSPGGGNITYIIDMTCCEKWGGTVYIIRFDPAVFNNKKENGEVRIMNFDVSEKPPEYGSVNDFCKTQGVNGWFYYSYNRGITYKELIWEDGVWRSHNIEELEIGGAYQSSRHNIASVRKWVCPAGGEYEVDAVYSQRFDSDMAEFVVKHDLEVIFQKRYKDEKAKLQGRYGAKLNMKRGEALFFEFYNPYQHIDDYLDIEIVIKKTNDK